MKKMWQFLSNILIIMVFLLAPLHETLQAQTTSTKMLTGNLTNEEKQYLYERDRKCSSPANSQNGSSASVEDNCDTWVDDKNQRENQDQKSMEGLQLLSAVLLVLAVGTFILSIVMLKSATSTSATPACLLPVSVGIASFSAALLTISTTQKKAQETYDDDKGDLEKKLKEKKLLAQNDELNSASSRTALMMSKSESLNRDPKVDLQEVALEAIIKLYEITEDRLGTEILGLKIAFGLQILATLSFAISVLVCGATSGIIFAMLLAFVTAFSGGAAISYLNWFKFLGKGKDGVEGVRKKTEEILKNYIKRRSAFHLFFEPTFYSQLSPEIFQGPGKVFQSLGKLFSAMSSLILEETWANLEKLPASQKQTFLCFQKTGKHDPQCSCKKTQSCLDIFSGKVGSLVKGDPHLSTMAKEAQQLFQGKMSLDEYNPSLDMVTLEKTGNKVFSWVQKSFKKKGLNKEAETFEMGLKNPEGLITLMANKLQFQKELKGFKEQVAVDLNKRKESESLLTSFSQSLMGFKEGNEDKEVKKVNLSPSEDHEEEEVLADNDQKARIDSAPSSFGKEKEKEEEKDQSLENDSLDVSHSIFHKKETPIWTLITNRYLKIYHAD